MQNTIAQGQRPTVEIFVASRCPHCEEIIDLLTRERIAYIAYDLERDPVAERDYLRSFGRGILPVVRVGDRHVRGFASKEILNLVNDANQKTNPIGDSTSAHTKKAEVVSRTADWPSNEFEKEYQLKVDALQQQYNALAEAQYKDSPAELDLYDSLGRLAVQYKLTSISPADMRSMVPAANPEVLQAEMSYVKQALKDSPLSEVVRTYQGNIDSTRVHWRSTIAREQTEAAEAEKNRKAAADELRIKNLVASMSPVGKKLIPSCKSGPLANSFREHVLTEPERVSIEGRIETFCVCMVDSCMKGNLIAEVQDNIISDLGSNTEILNLLNEFKLLRSQQVQPQFEDPYTEWLVRNTFSCSYGSLY